MLMKPTDFNALVLDDIHPMFLEELEALGINVLQKLGIERNELETIISQFDIIVVNSKTTIDKYLIDAATNLKFICRPGSGMENVDVAYAESKNIGCLNSPEGNCVAVAEHALAMIMMWYRNIRKAADEVRKGIWLRKENAGEELHTKTIGIVGYGHTGSALAIRAAALGMKVLAYDKYKMGFGNEQIEECSFDKIKSDADIISFHLPLTIETKYLANAIFFEQLKKEILLVNTSRGGVVETSALIKALQENKIKGACLDVLENENLKSWNSEEKKQYQFLFKQEHVLITPHIAGWTNESKYAMAAVLIQKLKKNLKIN